MKIIIKIFLLLFIINICSSQDNPDPKPLLFDFKDPQGIQHTQDTFSISNIPQLFTIGWQWGGHPRVTAAMEANMEQSTSWQLL